MKSTGRPSPLTLQPRDSAEGGEITSANSALLQLVDRLDREARVVATLPGARVHLDRRLPYLLVYRAPAAGDDAGTAMLVRGEASYLILESGHTRDDATALVRAVVEAGTRAFGAFLLLELWAGEAGSREYRVQGPREEGAETVAALADAMRVIARGGAAAEVVVESTTERHPPGLPELLSPRASRDLACLSLGLEVPPVWRADGEIYPVFLRTYKRAFSRALRQGIHEFVRVQTTAGIEDYRMLGPTRIEPLTLEADAELAAIEESYAFLLLVSPVNEQEAWQQFRSAGYEREPAFNYRLLPVDPDLLKRRLFAVQLEHVEDPAMAFLLRDKRDELDRQISMLADHGTAAFRASSERLYGALDGPLLATAHAILTDVAIPDRAPDGGSPVGAAAFAERARREIEQYRHIHPDLASTVTIRDDIVGLLVSRGQLMVGQSLAVRADRVEPLIQHEVGTHVLTFANGAAQPLKQLRYGLADYDELQEGLAVLAEYLVDGLSADRLRLLAARVVAVHALLQGAGFLDTFRLLRDEHGFSPHASFSIASRVQQSGGFTRDMIYLRGLERVMRHVARGAALDPLYIGKIAEKHIPVIEELRERGVLRAPPLRPRFLNDPAAQRRLDAVRGGLPITALVRSEGT